MQTIPDHQPLVRWLAYLIFFAVLNETVFNVSTPMIALEFGLSAATVSWVMTIFMMFFGIGSVIYGRLADLYSLRKLIEFGTCLYCAGSVLGFVVQDSYPLVILARAVQAMGASAIPALCFVVIARCVPMGGRGKVFGFITSVVSVSIGIGPVIGGMTLFSVVFGVFFLIPLMLSRVHELGTDQIGLLLFPGAISAVYFGPFAGALADRRGNSFVVGIGVLLLAGSMAAMALTLGFTFWVVLFAMVGNYIGFTMFQTAMVNSVSQTLQPEQSGIGMGIFNLISIVAGALGTTLVGRILDGQWLDSGLVSLSRNASGFAYSDILIILALVVLASGWVFRVTFTGVPLQAGATVQGH